jgi:hypothetical protein
MDQGHRQIEAALHSVGEGTNIIVAPAFQLDELEQLFDSGFEFGRSHTVQAPEKAEILGCAQLRI